MASSNGGSAMATGKWGNVHLANEGLTLLAIALAVDDSHGGECGSLTAWEHAAVVWVGGQDFKAHFSWNQLTSLTWFEDKLAELPSVSTGKDSNAGAAAGASAVERQARSLIVQLGYDVAKLVPLPAIADGKIDLSAFRRLKSLSSAPLPVEWLAKLATKLAIAHPGVADDVVQWLYTILQVDSKLTIQAAAVLSTADGDSATWDEIVAHIGVNLRCDEAFAATRLEAARIERTRAARPAGSAFAESWTALEYASAYTAKIGVTDALGAGGAAASAAAPAVNAVATAVAVDKFWFSAAKILRKWHELEVDRNDSESYLKNLVGASLRDIARLRDESPAAMSEASLTPGALHASPDEAVQHIMLLAKTGVPAGTLPSATGAAAAATAAVPAAAAAATAPMTLALDQKSIDALTKKRGSRGASASDPPGDNEPLAVGIATAAVNNSRYVQVEDSPVFMRVEPELLAALAAVRAPGADSAAVFDGLSSEAKWMLARQVHQKDKVNEPRLSPLTELQAQFAKGAIKALTEWYGDHDKRMFSADAAEARGNGLKAVFAAMRRSDLEKGGPHGLAPWGPLDTLWTFIKSKFSEEGSAEAVQLRNEWNAILRRWALEMEAQAGSCTGWVDGAEVIIDTLRYKAKSDAGIQWSEQQKTFYVGILFHAWADHDKKWQAAPEKNARKTVTEIDGGKFMRATKKELHQMTPANAPKEMPYCELTLGTTSSSASRQRAKSAGSASDAEDGDGADSASGWESDGAAKKRSPKKAKKAPAKQPAPAPDSLASLVNSVKKLHDKVSSNTAAFAKLGGKGGGDGGGGWQSKNSVLGANSSAGAGSGSNTGGFSALFVPWGKESEVQCAGVDTVKCLAAQEHVNSSKYSGCLKNCCIYALIGEHGCSAGGGYGEMGGCGNQHFSSEDDKENVPRELKKVLKLSYLPSIQHRWFQKGVIGGHGSHSSPGRGGKGAGKGGGRGGGGGGKGGGRGKGGK